MKATINFDDEDELRMTLRTVADVDRLADFIKKSFDRYKADVKEPHLNLFVSNPAEAKAEVTKQTLQEWVSERVFKLRHEAGYYELEACMRSLFGVKDRFVVCYKPKGLKDEEFIAYEEDLQHLRNNPNLLLIDWKLKEEPVETTSLTHPFEPDNNILQWLQGFMLANGEQYYRFDRFDNKECVYRFTPTKQANLLPLALNGKFLLEIMNGDFSCGYTYYRL